MSTTLSNPLGVYVHLPYCQVRCPYCDFNAHAITPEIPKYLEALSLDMARDRRRFARFLDNRVVSSIYFGGGTPSLFPGETIHTIIQMIKSHLPLSENTEITLEANPTEYARFADFRAAGINRISLGIQSFNAYTLSKLGRTYSKTVANTAIARARSHFPSLNLDIIFGLAHQNEAQMLLDLQTALRFTPDHLSWYILTIETGSLFYAKGVKGGDEGVLMTAMHKGNSLLEKSGFSRYEVSAWALPHKESQHNLLYWRTQDYLGIGAGAHGRLTREGEYLRTAKTRHPNDYLRRFSGKRELIENPGGISPLDTVLSYSDLQFERLLMGLRLKEGVPPAYWKDFEKTFEGALTKGWLTISQDGYLQPTMQGWDYLDDILLCLDSL